MDPSDKKSKKGLEFIIIGLLFFVISFTPSVIKLPDMDKDFIYSDFKIMTILGGVFTLGICLLFYYLAQKWDKRQTVPLIFGYIFLTFSLISALIAFTNFSSVPGRGSKPSSILPVLIPYLIIIVFLFLSFILLFKKSVVLSNKQQ
jgi:hypothetical protein